MILLVTRQVQRYNCRWVLQNRVRNQSSEANIYNDDIYSLIIKDGFKGMDEISKIQEMNELTLNQIIETDNEEKLKQLMKNFQSDIKFSIGYGSGVFQQKGYDKSSLPQIDMIHISEDTNKFHETNLKQFPKHYSFLKYFGMGIIDKIQNYGAGVYFNPYITMKDDSNSESMIKYGVSSRKNLLIDLTEWSSLYLAGRLQKPVKFLKDEDSVIKLVNQYNLKNASVLALIMLNNSKNKKFSETKLYETISQISYMGDPRMLIGGENPNKVKNIVFKQFKNFQKLYNPIIRYLINESYIKKVTTNEFENNLDLMKTSKIINQLPLQFRRRLFKNYHKKYLTEFHNDESAKKLLSECIGGRRVNEQTAKYSTLRSELADNDIGPFTLAIAKDESLVKAITSTIKYTVAYPAFTQTIKGICTAGLIKSVKYAWEKKIKHWNLK